jgi:hypothetical protein
LSLLTRLDDLFEARLIFGSRHAPRAVKNSKILNKRRHSFLSLLTRLDDLFEERLIYGSRHAPRAVHDQRSLLEPVSLLGWCTEKKTTITF